jgi:hypothetical protein
MYTFKVSMVPGTMVSLSVVFLPFFVFQNILDAM